MNESGKAVQSLISVYKLKPQACVIILDDIDLPLGTLRIREKGSGSTHNGLKSVINCLGT